MVTDTMAVVIGVICGVLAAVPTCALAYWLTYLALSLSEGKKVRIDMHGGYNIGVIRQWIGQECTRLEYRFAGMRITGGEVLAREIAGGRVIITGIDFQAVRNGTQLVLHTRSEGVMRPLTVVGFSGDDDNGT